MPVTSLSVRLAYSQILYLVHKATNSHTPLASLVSQKPLRKSYPVCSNSLGVFMGRQFILDTAEVPKARIRVDSRDRCREET